MNILITGVKGGIGTVLEREFKERGHRVIGVDVQDSDSEDYFKIDLSDLSALYQELKQIEDRVGIPGIVVHNAGLVSLEHFWEESLEKFIEVMDVNFTSVVFSTHFWLKRMIERGRGQIVNMSSMAGFVPPAGMTSYSASKHALVGFTQSLQSELAAHNEKVLVQLVCPGFINTDLINLGSNKGFPEEFRFLVSDVNKAGKKIAQKILYKEELIIPDTSGKLMGLAQRFFPKALQKLNILAAKKIKR